MGLDLLALRNMSRLSAGRCVAGLVLLLFAGCSLGSGVDNLKGTGGDSGATTGGSGGAGAGGDSGSSCPPGKKACGGACVDVSDPNTGCGGPSCDPCTLPHASPICIGGQCVPSQCAVGYKDCNGVASDGCEVPVDSDPANCGACFASCALPHAKVSCKGGACQFDGCETGFSDCDGDPKDGCEVNTQSDPQNCGSCGNACPAPTGKTAFCNNGQCGISNCVAPLADCDHDPTGSCETNLSSSVANCGFCGNACSYAHATASCNNGTCALGSCNSGYANCDNNPATGCETLVNTLQNCGACGNAIGVSGVAGGIGSGPLLCRVTGSGNTLTFDELDANGGCTVPAGTIKLSGFTASGSVQNPGGGHICGVIASGKQLTFEFFTAGCAPVPGAITLSGATASGSAHSYLCGATGSGTQLTINSENNGACTASGGVITFACSP